MSRKRNRKHSKIYKLNPAVKSEVESMILSNDFTYKEIDGFIKDSTGEMVSQAAVCRYAKGLCESLESVRFAQETFRAVNDELNRNPNIDTTEGIIQILSHMLLTNIQKLSEEDFEGVDPLKLLKQASDLVRTAAYKRNLDIKNKELTEMGFDAVKEKVFGALSKDNPELYTELTEYINTKLAEDRSETE